MELATHGGHLAIGPVAVQETEKLANHQQGNHFCWGNLDDLDKQANTARCGNLSKGINGG